jgi:hypothetical protein
MIWTDYSYAVASLAEKEFVARRAAAKGLLTEDLVQIRQNLILEWFA